jgi:transposase
MAANISLDLRERILRSVSEEGLSQADTARRFAVSESTVSRLIRAFAERGTLEKGDEPNGRKPKLGDEHFDWLRARIKESPFLSTYELTPEFNEVFPDVQVHRSTILRALHRIGLSVKKRPHWRRSDSRKN